MRIRKARITSSLISAVFFMGFVYVPVTCAQQATEQIAQQSAEAWLARVDAG